MQAIEPVTLTGCYVHLEPLRPDHDALGEIADPELFGFLPERPGDFEDWLQRSVGNSDPLFFAAIVNDRPVGRVAIQRIDLANGVAEIGHVLWGPALRRTPAATQAVFLLCDYLFGRGARRVEWKCDNRNEASKAAAARFGFTFEGVFRQHMIVKGQNRDTAWFSLLDSEWPQRRKTINAWLDPGNFDGSGRQISALRRPA